MWCRCVCRCEGPKRNSWPGVYRFVAPKFLSQLSRCLFLNLEVGVDAASSRPAFMPNKYYVQSFQQRHTDSKMTSYSLGANME